MAEPGRDENLGERDKGKRDAEIRRETNGRNALDNVETPAVRREDIISQGRGPAPAASQGQGPTPAAGAGRSEADEDRQSER